MSKDSNPGEDKKFKRKAYEGELRRLQAELCKLQDWVKHKRLRVVIVFEGRDGAGKGGTIRAITERLSPRVFRVIALPAPSDREKTQLYLQRYMQHFPASGEVVIFDRSWYNRAGVEHVMGFCTDEQHRLFLRRCPEAEKYMVKSGIILIKFWLEVSDQEQKRRFEARISDPIRQWKLSAIDLPSRTRWFEYSRARDLMLKATDTEWAPWHILRSDDKKRARLNCIAHLLELIPYRKVPRPEIKLPERSMKGAYDDVAALKHRRFVPREILNTAAPFGNQPETTMMKHRRHSESEIATGGRAALPVAGWFRSHRRDWAPRDILASVTLAAYLIPAALGDASLAQLAPEAGLYACLFSGLVFWLFCSSPYTVVSVTSAISLLIGASLGEIAGGDASRFGALAAGTALLVALIAFIAWLARAGTIVNFISESVMTGFKCGVALFLASTQLPKLFGFHGEHGSFWVNSRYFFKHLNETHAPSLLIGGLALAVLVLGKIFLKNKPLAVVVVVGGIIASSAFSLEARGVKLLGEVPQGFPVPGLPAIRWSDLNELFPLALACFLLGAVETAAIGRMFCAKHGGRLDANQEFLALAAANLAAGFGRGYPVSGGMSQSLVNEGAGARTPRSGAMAAGILLLVVLFFSGLLSALPQPVLAAVVLAAVAGLLKLATLKQLWRSDRAEFAVAGAALLGVLGSGLLRGVLIGAVISLAQLLRSASRPHVAVLGRIPGTRRFSDRERHPGNEPTPGALVFRPESGLVYFNVDHVCEWIRDRICEAPDLPKLLVLDLSAAPRVDLHGAQALAGLADEITARGIKFQVVEACSSVRERLRREALDDKLGGVNRFSSVADVLEEMSRGSPGRGGEAPHG